VRYAASGAREEGALGFPSVFGIGLPALRHALAAGRGMRRARLDALFALMAHVSDTNVYHRGGAAGAQEVRHQARSFIARGGTGAADWEAHALACHRSFVAARLSPGGAADLLGAVCLLQAVCTGQC
jgi:triphosphoribosyl-dephospho-CoA synthase